MSSRTEKILEGVGIVLSVAFVGTSFGLLISGALCFYGKATLSVSPSTCESIYVSGLLMSFIVGVVILFNLLFCLVNRLDGFPEQEPAAKPVVVLNKKKRVAEEKDRPRSRSRSSASEEEVVVKKKKVSDSTDLKNMEEGTFAVENPIKKKRSPSS